MTQTNAGMLRPVDADQHLTAEKRNKTKTPRGREANAASTARQHCDL
jgi:hypothetical protein